MNVPTPHQRQSVPAMLYASTHTDHFVVNVNLGIPVMANSAMVRFSSAVEWVVVFNPSLCHVRRSCGGLGKCCEFYNVVMAAVSFAQKLVHIGRGIFLLFFFFLER